MRLAELTSGEVSARIASGAIALWPIGSTEAHGPHLPLDTDVIIAEETCLRAVPRLAAALKLDALVLPPLAFSVTEFAGPFSGTIGLPRETAISYVRDVALSIARQGFRAVCLVNGHVEPAHRFTLRDAIKAAGAVAVCPIGLADPADARFARTLTEEFAGGSCHAGQYETSLILAASRAGSVREERRAALPKLEIDLVAKIRAGAKTFVEAGAPDAYCGDPGNATREEGEASYARLVEIVVQVATELLARREQP